MFIFIAICKIKQSSFIISRYPNAKHLNHLVFIFCSASKYSKYSYLLGSRQKLLEKFKHPAFQNSE